MSEDDVTTGTKEMESAGVGSPWLHFFRQVRRLAAELDAREQVGADGVTEHEA